MLIGIDVSRTAEIKTGLGSYGRSLIEALARQDKTNEYLLHPFVKDVYPADHKKAFCPAQSNFRLARRAMPKALTDYLWRKPWVDKDWLVGGDPDVYFSPFHCVPERRFRRHVSVFHDVSFRVHPEFSTPENTAHCELHFERARRLVDKLITVSHFSKAQIVEHMGVPADWVEVTHEAADPMFRRIEGCALPERIRKDIGTPDPIILYVGSVEPRKNLATLIRAFDGLRQRGRSQPTLIIAGGSGWKNSDVYQEIQDRGLESSVYFTGFVTDEELVALYNTATLFAFPTIYEGFGLPVIEAMSSGAPVVTSRVASIPEVGGDAVAYVDDPMDDEALIHRMEEILVDPERQAELRQRGFAQAATFSWDRAARETLAVLESVHAAGDGRRRVVMGQDERGLGRGWHGLEAEGERHYRWSEREGTVRLQPANGQLALEVAGGVPGEQQVLAVRIDGAVIGNATLRGGWQELRFPLGPNVPRDRDVEVALGVNFDLPRSLKGADSRTLGARIAKVSFE